MNSLNNHDMDGTSAAEASSSSNANPFSQHDENDDLLQDDHQLDTSSSIEDLSMNAALGIDASEYPTYYSYVNPRTNPLSFKRRQAQRKPLSRFISHLYSFPKRNARQRPSIRISPPNDYDIPPELDDNELQDIAEQGYDKEALGDWVAEGGVGARKYDDLTAIGTHVQDLC